MTMDESVVRAVGTAVGMVGMVEEEKGGVHTSVQCSPTCT